VSNLEQATSEALAEPYARVLSNVRTAQVLHADETSWFQRAKQCWLWVATTTSVAAFIIGPKRNRKIAQELIGRKFTGVLVTDQYGVYSWLHDGRRQFCWAHLIRHFRALLDYADTAAFGQQLLDACERLFAQWHRIRDGTLRRRDFPAAAAPLQLEFHQLLEQGAASPSSRVQSLCKGLLRHELALWTFVHRKGVEPTNNAAERALRHGVLWRKTSFGTDSDRGTRFVERVLTVVTTLRLQSRNVLDYLTHAITAHHLRLAPLSPFGG
jgi:transposase